MNYNIFLVEDNSGFRQALADTLLEHFATMNIAEAGSGEDALIKVEGLHTDMIFMDINLPGVVATAQEHHHGLCAEYRAGSACGTTNRRTQERPQGGLGPRTVPASRISSGRCELCCS